MNGPRRKSPAPVAAGSEARAISPSSQDNIALQLIAGMRDAGIPPAKRSQIIADGILHRYDVVGDRPGRQNGWYVLFRCAVPCATFGSWKAGVRRTWRPERQSRLTVAERHLLRQRADTVEAKRLKRQARRYEDASIRAKQMLRRSTSADPRHAYLIAKHIQPHSACQRGDRLVLRIVDFNRSTCSLQFIGPDGEKRLLKGGRKAGGFIPVDGRMPGASRVLIAEGFATAATLAEFEPHAFVIAAIDAGNLRAVAVGARRQWPDAEIVICADADDVGRAKGRAAAIAASALLAVPDFPPGGQGTDFNDLANLSKEVIDG